MPDKSRLKCYFGCINDGPLHHFPNPKSKNLEDIKKFSNWKAVLDVATQEKGNVYIYNHILLCNNHFLEFYQLPSRRLTRNAVPTLNLEQHQLRTPAATESAVPLQTSTVITRSIEHKILSKECQGTADFLLLFDMLFDSYNGHSYEGSAKPYKQCLKHNSPHFQLWSDLLPILESIKFESVVRRNDSVLIKHKSILSIKNWIHNIIYINLKGNVAIHKC